MEPDWPAINRAISESIEASPTRKEGEWVNGKGVESDGGAWWKPFLGLSDERWLPQDWREPAAAMELLKRMPNPSLQRNADGTYWCTSSGKDGMCPIEKPEDIEVTREMIEAGLEFYPCDDDSFEWKAKFLTNIFRAMRLIEIRNMEAVIASSHEHIHKQSRSPEEAIVLAFWETIKP